MPRVNNSGLGSGQGSLLSKTVNLTAADILALNTTPFTLVPAPGAGLMVVVLGNAYVARFVSHPYQPAGGGNNETVHYAGDTVQIASAAGGDAITAAQSGFEFGPGRTVSTVLILPGSDNKAVVLSGDDLHGGPIVTATLGAGGAGYAANDTGAIDTGNGDATYKVLTVDGGGAVLTFSITAPGSSYAVSNGVTTTPGGAQPGVGAGFTVNITAVQNGDGTLKVVTYYQIIPVP